MRRSEPRLWLAALVLAGCVADTSAEPSRTTRPRRDPTPSAERAPALTYVEHLTNGAEASARVPTLIALHGLGDTPENFIRFFEALDVPARIVCPRAPIPYSGGFAWTTTRVRDGDPRALDAALDARVAQLVSLLDALEARPEIEPPFVVAGFSQGGILTYALTLRAPSRVRAAFPISGMLPRARLASLPSPPGRAPRILAFHGDADTIVPYEDDLALVEALRARGWPIELHTAQGMRHLVLTALHGVVLGAIEESLRSAP